MTLSPPPSALKVPFDETSAIFTQIQPSVTVKLIAVLPTAYHQHDPKSKRTWIKRIDSGDDESVREYLRHETNVDRLNTIHKHLWFAGLPRIARPLHEQLTRGFKVVVTERADCHLVWQNDTIFVKPLPQALMDHGIWKAHICHDQRLYEAASGLLLSYLWLICYESDFIIAHDTGLLSRNVDWPTWAAFANSALARISCDRLEHINPRYLYGELRLDRLNTIYRWCSATTNFTIFIRGYNYTYTSYLNFFQKNTAWLLVTIVYITIVLTAMQVGLATEQLAKNTRFNRASYGFTVFSILGPLIVVVAVTAVIMYLVLFNLAYALDRRRDSEQNHCKVHQIAVERQYHRRKHSSSNSPNHAAVR